MQPEKNCLHRKQHRKKLFVLKKFSSPSSKKNNGPSLSASFGDRWLNFLFFWRSWRLDEIFENW